MKKGRHHFWHASEDEYASEDDVHTPENPYCDDPDCWCHTDMDYHEEVTHPDVTDEEITQAYHFFGLSWRRW